MLSWHVIISYLKILNDEVSIDLVRLLLEASKPDIVLDDSTIKQIISLLTNIYHNLLDNGYLELDMTEDIYDEFLKRIITSSRCTPKYVSGIHPSTLAKKYWESLIPDNIIRVLQVIKKPSVVISKIRQLLGELFNDVFARRRDKPNVEKNSSMNLHENGITIVILSYMRKKALRVLLRSLYEQNHDDIPFEIMICNNSNRVNINKVWYTKLGRELNKFTDLKIFNSSHNWNVSVRYSIATLAKYETILFLDDDINILDRNFVKYMYEAHQKLRPFDILSCWNTLWVNWTEEYIENVGINFNTDPEITDLVETDTCGAGICMFSKSILFNENIQNNPPREFIHAHDMAFGPISAIEHGSRMFFLPSFGMLRFHNQMKKSQLSQETGHYDDLYALYKFLIYSKGYKPVLSRRSLGDRVDSPETRISKILNRERIIW